MRIEICGPKTKEEFEKYRGLRYRVLYEPWGQPRGSEIDEHEAESVHVMARKDSKIVGVGRVRLPLEKHAHISFVAVEEPFRENGVGTLIMKELEKLAKKRGATFVTLDARENALGFYKENGYNIVKKSHLLFGEIQHWEMKKILAEKKA